MTDAVLADNSRLVLKHFGIAEHTALMTAIERCVASGMKHAADRAALLGRPVPESVFVFMAVARLTSDLRDAFGMGDPRLWLAHSFAKRYQAPAEADHLLADLDRDPELLRLLDDLDRDQ